MIVQHDPNAILDYSFDWKYATAAKRAAANIEGGWLAAGETITTSTWTTDPATITVQVSPAPSNTDGRTTAWLTGGTPGVTYRLTNRIVTSTGRQDERSMLLEVTQR